MQRRDFVRYALTSGLVYGAGARLMPRLTRAQLPQNDRSVVLSITLRGGPDFRHLMPPPFDATAGSYGNTYWSNRYRSHNIGDTLTDWEQHSMGAYFPVELGGVPFGVLRRAEWLKDQIEAGNVAIVNNVLASTTRDHHHSLLVYESGDRRTTAQQLTRDGWGGRLAQQVQGNVVSMTGGVRLFCNGRHPSDPLQHDNSSVITARNTREMSLFRDESLDTDPASTGTRAVMSRALESYYAAKASEISKDSPYKRFTDHEKSFRAFGELVDARLAQLEIPPSIAALYEGDNPLNQSRFGEQLRNVFDSFACSDIFNFRVGSLIYDGWDSHKWQADGIEPSFEDLFGAGRGLATLFAELEATMPDAVDNTVVVIGGEFGRQLADNGDGGTDHGRGNSVLVIGKPVRGGVYGQQYPDSEIPLFSAGGKDITGETAIEALFAAVCDWAAPGSGPDLFPDLGSAPVEPGVSLSDIFTA